MITHVIGFGTTPEELTILQGVSGAGGGLLLGASSAGELRGALFDILEELQIVVGAGYVGGNAFPLIPQGNPGELSVVSYGVVGTFGTEVPFVVRNNTGDDLVALKVGVTVRDSAGTLLAAGESTKLAPFFVRSGGVAFGSIWLGETLLPPDAVLTFEVSSTPPDQARFLRQADLDIVEASFFENRIVGTAQNGFDYQVGEFETFHGACFDDLGNVTYITSDTPSTPVIQPDETVSFQLELFETTFSGVPCTSFLVAGYAMGEPRLPEPLTAPTASGSSSSDSSPAPETADTADADQPVSENDGFFLPGLRDAAYRGFTSNSGVGILSIDLVVLEFDSEESANTALGLVRDRTNAWAVRVSPEFPQQFYVSGPNEISAPQFGDASIAESSIIDNQGFQYSASSLYIQRGPLVYIVIVAAAGADPVPTALEMTELTLNRTPDQIPDDLFTLLPTLSEVPTGMFLENERLPISLGPIPAPDSE
jgi:hypothetical protein